jgi:hypothetical protein
MARSRPHEDAARASCMTANGSRAAVKAVMGEMATFDSEGTLARRCFRLKPTSQFPPISPQADQFWQQIVALTG